MKVFNFPKTRLAGEVLLRAIILISFIQLSLAGTLKDDTAPDDLLPSQDSTTDDLHNEYRNATFKWLRPRTNNIREWEDNRGVFVRNIFDDFREQVDQRKTKYIGNNNPADNFGHVFLWNHPPNIRFRCGCSTERVKMLETALVDLQSMIQQILPDLQRLKLLLANTVPGAQWTLRDRSIHDFFRRLYRQTAQDERVFQRIEGMWSRINWALTSPDYELDIWCNDVDWRRSIGYRPSRTGNRPTCSDGDELPRFLGSSEGAVGWTHVHMPWIQVNGPPRWCVAGEPHQNAFMVPNPRATEKGDVITICSRAIRFEWKAHLRKVREAPMGGRNKMIGRIERKSLQFVLNICPEADILRLLSISDTLHGPEYPMQERVLFPKLLVGLYVDKCNWGTLECVAAD